MNESKYLVTNIGDTVNDTKDDTRAKLLDERQTSPKYLENWMTNISPKLHNISIWKLTIPGSHDSGSYGLEIESGISPDEPELKNSLLMRLCSCITMPVVHRWTKTQTLSITDQLKAGIRYFDFRVTTKTTDNSLYFCHGLYGPKIIEMLLEINAYLKENPKEIVFVDFQHFYSLSDDDHKNLIAQIINIFGRRLVPYASQLFMDRITLNYLWSKGQQIFVYYREERARMQNPILWPSRCLPNPWPNTMSTQTLVNFLTSNINDRPLNSMFVSQGILTPSNTYVKLHLFSSLEKDLSLSCNRVLLEWLKLKSAGPKGPNIVMSDFIEWNNYEIPILTVQLNKLLNEDKK